MEIITSKNFTIEDKTAVAIGKFDGIHMGHKTLLNRIIEVGHDRGFKTCVFTFNPSAASFFSDGNIKEVTTCSEKRVIFEEMGIDILVEFPLNKETASIEADEFVNKILVDSLNAGYVAAGYDISFGYKGAGNADLLQSEAKERFDVEIIDKVMYGNREISSTYVREEISAGHMELVTELLGHPYSFSGKVMPGAKLGRKLGFPTMNLYPDAQKELPPMGVYYSSALFEGATYPGLTNIGVRPTVSDGQSISVETYLYDFDRDMYGKNITIELLSFKRSEQKFNSAVELREQLRTDIEAGREFCNLH